MQESAQCLQISGKLRLDFNKERPIGRVRNTPKTDERFMICCNTNFKWNNAKGVFLYEADEKVFFGFVNILYDSRSVSSSNGSAGNSGGGFKRGGLSL